MSIASMEAAVRVLPHCSRRTARKLRRVTRQLAVKRPGLADWIRFIDGLAWADRGHLLEWVLRAEADIPLTDSLRAALLVALDHYPAAFWRGWEFPEVVAAVRRGVPVFAFETWGWLRGNGEAGISLRICGGAGFPFPLAVARAMVTEWDWTTREAVEGAWVLCARVPQHTRILLEEGFNRLPLAHRVWLMEICTAKESVVDPWRVLAALLEMGDAERDTLTAFGGVRWGQVAKLTADGAVALVRRWPKMREPERVGLKLMRNMVKFLSTEQWEAVALAPAAVLTRVGKARHNRQLWWETVNALEWMNGVFPGLLLDGLLAKPEVLFECGARLAVFGEVRANRLLRGLRTHVLFTFEAEEGLVALDRLLCAHRELAVTVPAFATWDRHFAGERVLGVVAIGEVAAQMMAGLTSMRLRFLVEHVERELALFGDAHAGMLRAGLWTGRKPMVRFLREFVRGRDRRLELAANREWLASRPGFRLDRWLQPLRITLPVAGLGEVTLGVEEDPFELLRIGTYARTCLAAGAANSGNAVAVLLDVNKRAIFARNGSGKFLARQIVAVSDTGYFVCYSVYPDKPGKALEEFFQLYVEDWAMQMGTPMARSGDDWGVQEVRGLTIARWYDDGIWERAG